MLVHGSPVLTLPSAISPTKSLAPPRGTCRQSVQSSQETIHEGVAYQSHASTGGIQTSLRCWWMGGCNLVADGQTRVSALSCAQEKFGKFPRKRNVGERWQNQEDGKSPACVCAGHGKEISAGCTHFQRSTACSVCTSAARQISVETTGVVGSLPTA